MDLKEGYYSQESPYGRTVDISNDTDSKRPLGVTILAVLLIVAAVLSILNLLSYFSISSSINTYIPSFFGIFSLIITIIITIFYSLIAYGFFKAKRWSWNLSIILILVTIILNIFSVALNALIFSNDLYFSSLNSYYLMSVILLVAYIVLYASIIYYLTRGHVKRYFHKMNNKTVGPKVEKNNKSGVVIALILVILASVLAWGFIPSQSISITNISQNPDNPIPGDEISITAEVTGGSPFFGPSVSFEYVSYFGSGISSGGGTMRNIGNNIYSRTIDSDYRYDEEIWYMIRAGNKITDPQIIQIGDIQRSDISTLAINDVTQNPINPTTDDWSVLISAKVTSDFNIDTVYKMYQIFYPSGSRGGGGSISRISEDTYSFEINLQKDYMLASSQGVEAYPKGSKVFYRIAAKDDSGNTAVTDTYSFLIN